MPLQQPLMCSNGNAEHKAAALTSTDNCARRPAPIELVLLGLCEALRTADEHRRVITDALRVPPSTADALVQRLVTEGWMVTLDELLRRFPIPNVDNARLPPFDYIAIVTRDRPSMLRRLLKCLKRSPVPGMPLPVILVLDDSRSIQMQNDYRTVTELAAADLNTRVVHITRDVQMSLIQRLIKHCGLPSNVTSFALCPENADVSIGAARNVLQVLTQKSRVLYVDDDTIPICRQAADADPSLRVTLTSHCDPSGIRFHSSFSQAYTATYAFPESVLSIHSRWLGRSLQACLAGMVAQDLRLPPALCPHLSRGLIQGDGRIGITMGGILGHPGTGCTGQYMYHPDPNTRRSYSAWRAFRSSEFDWPPILRQPRTVTIAHGGLFMATSFAIDNAHSLPPFFPILRGEDSIFSTLLSALCGSLYTCHLPVVILHLPTPSRLHYDSFRDPTASDLFCGLINQIASESKGPRQMDVNYLGNRLEAIGSLPPISFNDLLDNLWRVLTEREVAEISAVIEAPVSDTDESTLVPLLARKQHLQNSLVERPRGSHAPSDMQRWLKTFGGTLTCWPLIQASSAQLIDMIN